MRIDDSTAMKSEYVKRPCPNCGSDEGAALAGGPHEWVTGRGPGVRSGPGRPIELFDREDVLQLSSLSEMCQLYCPCYFSANQLAEVYSSMGPNMEDASPEAVRRTQCGYVRQLFRRPLVDGDFLEIGPDVGYFAEAVLQRRPLTRCWLFEPNRQVHAELLRRVEGTPAELFTEMFDLSLVPEGEVAVAAMIHVLDHLLEPKPYLEQLFAKLRPGGLLVIVVHDDAVAAPDVGRSMPHLLPFPSPGLQSPYARTDAPRRRFRRGRRGSLNKLFSFDLSSSECFHFDFSNTAAAAGVGPGCRCPVKLGNSLAVARKKA